MVEHDLSVLDYLSDYICCLYGAPGAYGVVTMPFSVREGKRTKNEYQYTLKPDKSSLFVYVAGQFGLTFSSFLFLNSINKDFSEFLVLKWKIPSCFNGSFMSNPYSQHLDAILIL